MTAAGVPTNAKQLAALLKKGEGPTLEFERSTGELKEGTPRQATKSLATVQDDERRARGAEGDGAQTLMATDDLPPLPSGKPRPAPNGVPLRLKGWSTWG